MPEGLLPHQQHISDVSAQNHSQAFAGSARDVYFGASKFEDPQKRLEQACRNAIFLTNPAVDREKLITTKGARVAGTCEWITRHGVYQRWLCGDTRLLWISGGPGKGKTMMSIFLTEELEGHTHNASVVFFFCSAQDEKRNTGIAILRGLIHQMVTKRPQLVRHALPDFASPEQTQQTLSSFEALWLIFKNIAADAELGTMFCVLDGLDECHEDTVRSLVPRIVDLLCCGSSTQDSARKTIALRLLIVSREVQGLQKCSRVRLDPDNNENVISDIERVVSIRVDELSHINGFNDSIHRTVKTTLLQRAEGTFLWVGFAVHELSQKQTCSQVLEVLESLPKGLPEIYRRMILRIPAEERQMISSILRWVTLALRPLTLLELASAVGVQSPHQLIGLEDAIREKIAFCGPLLKVQELEVSLVHQSVRDYLLRKEEDSDVVLEAYRIAPQNVHLKILQSCLDCIAQSEFQQKSLSIHNKPFSQKSPLLQYATIHWPEHARSCATRDPDLLRLLKNFLENEHIVRRHWWETYRVMTYVWTPDVLPLLHMVCYLGFDPLVQAALAWDNWKPCFLRRVNRRDSKGNTALHLGVLGGRKAIVQLLLDSGVDINAKAMNGKTALHMAILHEKEDIVRLLVDRGAEKATVDNDGRSVLHDAMDIKNEFVVQLLVGKGVDVRATDPEGRTVLHHAVESNLDFTVHLLVKEGADVKATDDAGWTVLHGASLKLGRHRTMARLLIERGLDIEHRDQFGRTVLALAAEILDEKTVQALVELGADVNAEGDDGWTPLHQVVNRGFKTATDMLLERGADLTAETENGWTPLDLAISRSNEALVRRLEARMTS